MRITTIPTDVRLTERCWSCRTPHNEPVKPALLANNGLTCEVCNGFGVTLTDLGKEWLDLLTRMGVTVARMPCY